MDKVFSYIKNRRGELSTLAGILLAIASGLGYVTAEQLAIAKQLLTLFSDDPATGALINAAIAGALAATPEKRVRQALAGGVKVVALVALVATFFPVVSVQAADVLSEHDQQHVAEQAARDRLKADGCAWTKTTRAQRFRVTVDPLGVRVLGNELLVTCTEPASAPEPAVLRLTWTAPAQREDGATLSPAEIRGYQVSVNDQLVAMTAATEYQVEKTDAPMKLSVRTVDTGGRISVPAEVTK